MKNDQESVKALASESVEQEPEEVRGAFDWLGRPATAKHGGSKTSIFILGNQAMWNIANLAVGSNLVIYLIEVLQMSSAAAATSVTNWAGSTLLFTLVGGFLGDAYWGRFWTCTVFQGVHLLGLVLLALTVTLDALKPPSCPALEKASCPRVSGVSVNLFFTALYIIALGTGGYITAFVTMGADQLNSEKERTAFFAWMYFCTNLGTVFSVTVLVYLENQGRWPLCLWLATGLGAMAMLVFCAGVPTYRNYKPGGNPITRVARVLVAALRKWRVKVSKDAKELYELSEEELIEQGSRKIEHTNNFRCLDKAATIEGRPNELQEPWRLCSVTQVEEVKSVCLMMPVWCCSILFVIAFAQGNTFFVEQAALMNTKIAGFKIPPASTSLFNVATILLITALYPIVVVPLTRKITGRKEGLTQLQRIGMGQVCTALSVAVAALVESRRLRLLHTSNYRISVFWIAPQYVILGIGQVLGYVGGSDFFYSKAPHSMRSILSSLSLAILAIGCFASSILVTLVVHFTNTDDDHPGWIPPNLDHGHLDYFYWLMFAIILFSIATFTVVARWYETMTTSTSLSHVTSPSMPLLPEKGFIHSPPNTHSQPMQV